jgi:hypothetical protein
MIRTKMRRKTIPDERCSMAKRSMCDLQGRITRREEKRDRSEYSEAAGS